VQADFNSHPIHAPLAARVVLLLVGFTAVIGQIVLMRELIVLFNGNELSLGIMLATWLLWTAAGSSLTGRIAAKRWNPDNAVAVAECLCGLSLPLTVWALRSARALFQTVPGELLGPVPMLLITLVCLSLFCGLSGSLFVLAARMYERRCAVSGRLATSYAYLLETAGSALGGVLTSIVLLRAFGSFQIALMLALLNLGVAASLLFKLRRAQVAAVAAAGVILAIPLLMYVAPRLERSAQERLWTGFQVLGSQDSMYGKLTVVDAGGMRSIYDNGAILANVPDEAAAEETVHYALLEHPAPKRVLLIGGGLDGSIAEALKHPTLERLDYVELDPALPAMFQRYFPAESARAFSDPRVHVHSTDGRLYLKTSGTAFDAIILSVPDPQTAQLNRFYTAEFFQSVRDHLAPGGLLALQLRASEETISPRLAEFLRCIHRTLREVFPHVVILPGETMHFFAAVQPGVLTDDPQVLVARLQSRNLQTLYVREYFIPFRMMPDRMAQVHDLLQPLPGTPVNRDFQPVAYYFGAVLWSAQFRSGYSSAFEAAAQIRFRLLVTGVAALSLLLVVAFGWLAAPGKRARAAAVWSVCATGYTLMALQILLLLAFQSVYGYVYGELAMLIGMFMAGIAVGSWLGIDRFHSADRKSLLRAAATNQLLLAVAAPLLLFLVHLLARGSGAGASLWVAQAAFPALAVLCGIPGGLQFPIATEIYLRDRETQSGTGTLYALDLLGGCAGALLLAGFLIPVFGFWKTAALAAAISAAPALLAARATAKPE
jgi:spermidine synthase